MMALISSSCYVCGCIISNEQRTDNTIVFFFLPVVTRGIAAKKKSHWTQKKEARREVLNALWALQCGSPKPFSRMRLVSNYIEMNGEQYWIHIRVLVTEIRQCPSAKLQGDNRNLASPEN